MAKAVINKKIEREILPNREIVLGKNSETYEVVTPLTFRMSPMQLQKGFLLKKCFDDFYIIFDNNGDKIFFRVALTSEQKKSDKIRRV